MRIVLASASPRRRELLGMLFPDGFEIIPAVGDEVVPEGLTPGEVVEAISRAKAEEIAAKCGSDALVIAADTIVCTDGRILGKPSSTEDAMNMLRCLAGKTHEVFTGVAVILNGSLLCAHERTAVTFRELEESEIEHYVATGEPMDKAGAYAVQGIGAQFVERIEGDYFNVMGLPVCRLGRMLKLQGVSVL